jgi:hypothetical protein
MLETDRPWFARMQNAYLSRVREKGFARDHYSLPAILAVGYRVRSTQGTGFPGNY